jgi:hypothetical protein
VTSRLNQEDDMPFVRIWQQSIMNWLCYRHCQEIIVFCSVGHNRYILIIEYIEIIALNNLNIHSTRRGFDFSIMDDAHAQLCIYFEFRSDCNNNNNFVFGTLLSWFPKLWINRITFSSFLHILTFGGHLTPGRSRRTSIVLCYSNRTV